MSSQLSANHKFYAGVHVFIIVSIYKLIRPGPGVHRHCGHRVLWTITISASLPGIAVKGSIFSNNSGVRRRTHHQKILSKAFAFLEGQRSIHHTLQGYLLSDNYKSRQRHGGPPCPWSLPWQPGATNHINGFFHG